MREAISINLAPVRLCGTLDINKQIGSALSGWFIIKFQVFWEPQGGCSEGFEIIFGQDSVNYPDDFFRKESLVENEFSDVLVLMFCGTSFQILGPA